MNESILINLGFKFEKAHDVLLSRMIATQIREILENLDIEDRSEARRLIEIGRSEARL
jgi:hypothetical protein